MARTNLTWINRSVDEHDAPFPEMRQFIPTFRKEPFQLNNEAENKYTDVIVRDPLDGDFDNKSVPLVTVSKNYSLVQHHEILDTIEDVLQKIDRDLEVHGSLKITEYGERLWLDIKFPDISFDPGDGQELTFEMNAINSVDGSLPLTFEMGWWRKICKNGMRMYNRGLAIRKKHTKLISGTELLKLFDNSTDYLNTEIDMYKLWYNKTIDLDSNVIEDWINSTVRKRWGVWMAARSYHAITTAHNSNVDIADAMQEEKRSQPHLINVFPTEKIPGSKPVETVYDVVNSISYLASHQESLHTRYKQINDVPILIKDLEERLNN